MFSPSENIEWMSLNIFLAFLGVAFGYLFYFKKLHQIKGVILILWILFLPNTLYLVTDLQYLPGQLMRTNNTNGLILLVQYFLLLGLGIITFDMSVSLFDSFVKSTGLKKYHIGILILINLLVGFAIVMGKIQRTNSWYVFTDFYRVLDDVQLTLNSVPLIKIALLIGIFGNIIYFSTHRMADYFNKGVIPVQKKRKR